MRQAVRDGRLRAFRSNMKTLGRESEAPPRNLSKALAGSSGNLSVDELGVFNSAFPEPKEIARTAKADVGSIQAVEMERHAALITANLAMDRRPWSLTARGQRAPEPRWLAPTEAPLPE